MCCHRQMSKIGSMSVTAAVVRNGGVVAVVQADGRVKGAAAAIMTGCATQSRRGSRCHGSGWCPVRTAGGPAGTGRRVLSPAGDPAVLRSDGQRAADGTGRSQPLDDRRSGRASRAAPAAALLVPRGLGRSAGPGHRIGMGGQSPRPPSPPALECLRRDNTMITANCSCLPGQDTERRRLAV